MTTDELMERYDRIVVDNYNLRLELETLKLEMLDLRARVEESEEEFYQIPYEG